MELPAGPYKEVSEEATRQRRTLQAQIQVIVDQWLEKKRTVPQEHKEWEKA